MEYVDVAGVIVLDELRGKVTAGEFEDYAAFNFDVEQFLGHKLVPGHLKLCSYVKLAGLDIIYPIVTSRIPDDTVRSTCYLPDDGVQQYF